MVAVATRAAPDLAEPSADDERGPRLAGFLTFVDRPKADAAAAIATLGSLGVSVKIITGDNGSVAAKVCRDIGLAVEGVMSGAAIDGSTTTRSPRRSRERRSSAASAPSRSRD